MKLDRVTITGADDQARVDDLIALSKEFPFVEWGILLASDDRSGSPRYPSREAITNFAYWSSEAGMQLSLHLCGTHTREIFLGYSTFAEINPVSFAVFRRIQVNYRSVPENTSIPSLIAFLRRHSRNDSLGRKRQFIFQFRDDGDLINRIHADGEGLDVVALFDASGGRGGQVSAVDAPSPTVTTKDRLGVVTVHGQEYQIMDIGLRMLTPRELLRAQFGKYAKGYILTGTKSQQVARIGNSVPPELAEAVVRANFAEEVEAAA